jgi:uncharacterized protein (TIGR02147 family)
MDDNYRKILQKEFLKRRANNPAYSLRAFANQIGITASRLSQILNEKQGLSNEKAELIARRLKMSEFMRKYFCALVESEHARSKEARDIALQSVRSLRIHVDYERISFEQLEMIADWYHTPILELTKVKNFKPDVQWVANALNITPAEVELAVERLKNLGFIEDNGKTWIGKSKTTAGPSISPEKRSLAVKQFSTGIHELAGQSMERPLSKEKGHVIQVISMDMEKLQEFKSRIVDFSRELATDADAFENKDEVYCIYFNIFPMTRAREKIS